MSDLKLEAGSRVAVIGAGPAGSFFSYFVLDFAQRAGLDITVEIYEARDFDKPGPVGCNNCGGIISEWLVQSLATDGINLPPTVVERGIDSYVLHMDIGDVRIETPLNEKRIGAVHRGAGPRGIKEIRWRGFDSFLFEQARQQGARWMRGRVDAVELREGRPFIKMSGGEFQGYDLLAVAMGKNASALKIFEPLHLGYQPPKMTKTYITEIYLGEETVAAYLGSSMHVFLLNLPRLEFAALIPKGDYATLVLLGHEIDRELVQTFVNSAQVKMCLPPGWVMPADACHCAPFINVEGAVQPFADRIVFIGDCGVTRLYKDGIGAAYRTAKAAARTAVFTGIAADDFRQQYVPLLKSIRADNLFGRVIFMVTRLIQMLTFARRGVLRMVAREQAHVEQPRRMSTVLWDTFTGSAPYREVFARTLHPVFLAQLLADVIVGMVPTRRITDRKERAMAGGELGKIYRAGEVIFHQGDVGDSMYVIQSGQVEVVREQEGKEVRIAVRGEGEIIGEMAIVEQQARSATVRVLTEARILTIDKRTFLRRVHEDPSLAYRIMQEMSGRIRDLSAELAQTKAAQKSKQDVPEP